MTWTFNFWKKVMTIYFRKKFIKIVYTMFAYLRKFLAWQKFIEIPW